MRWHARTPAHLNNSLILSNRRHIYGRAKSRLTYSKSKLSCARPSRILPLARSHGEPGAISTIRQQTKALEHAEADFPGRGLLSFMVQH